MHRKSKKTSPRLFTVENCEEKLRTLFAYIKVSEQFLQYSVDATDSDSYSYDANVAIAVFGEFENSLISL